MTRPPSRLLAPWIKSFDASTLLPYTASLDRSSVSIPIYNMNPEPSSQKTVAKEKRVTAVVVTGLISATLQVTSNSVFSETNYVKRSP